MGHCTQKLCSEYENLKKPDYHLRKAELDLEFLLR